MYMNKTLRELLTDPAIAAIGREAISNRDLSKEEFYDWTLAEIAERMGWRILNRGFTRLFRAAERGQYLYPLYDDAECAAEPARRRASIVYLPSDDPAADERPFMLLVPGGGFVNVWNITEGWPMATYFNERGYHAFVLTYQVDVEAAGVRAMGDVSRALEVIAAHREAFRVDPARYMTCGFSAGGYLVCLWNTSAGYSAYGKAKPAACIPVYPVTSYRLMAAEEWDEGEDKDAFARSVTGCSMEGSCNSCFEIPLHPEGFPPTAIFAAAEDDMVDPEHSRSLARALEGAGIPCYLEIGPTGGHGFADGEGMCMEGWPFRALDLIEQHI